MVTRYSVNMADRIIEPNEEGQWVKFKDYQQMESSLEERVKKGTAENMGEKLSELEAQKEQVVILTAANEKLWADLGTQKERSENTIARQIALLDAAKERLMIHGHAGNCQSRYGSVTADGTEAVGRCNCGLDEWFRETGTWLT